MLGEFSQFPSVTAWDPCAGGGEGDRRRTDWRGGAPRAGLRLWAALPLSPPVLLLWSTVYIQQVTVSHLGLGSGLELLPLSC